ncbi:tetratricopeptide repeat protein [Phycisphaerales bacterium AB-hyl4]|uniref:Tetratricopeptide repeat protein n=1 Tax=Natronomicrosphaera hydrolytica TaxID=3242702 RepID=A0ABV4U656_9BACT
MKKIEPQHFLDVVRPPLAQGDAAELARAVLERWSARDVCVLLQCPQQDVRRVAAVVIGLVGDGSCIGCLTHALHDTDEQVNQMAEHGLWSIWFRASQPAAAQPFHEGVALLSMECQDDAIRKFTQAIDADPDFAEAYNQRSIAHFLAGRWQAALDDGHETIARMPIHFGAIAGMGHCHAHRNELDHALACYRRALAINPRMPAIARAVERLEHKLHGVPVPAPKPSHRGAQQ